MRFPLNTLFAALLLFSACANRVTPTGGPRDTQAPLLQRVSPENASLNVKPGRIVFDFDENIQLAQGRGLIRLSPPTAEPVSARAERNRLTVDIPDSLRENTTYILSLGQSVSDVNESNVLKGLSYRFSTGAVLDTLRISGVVRDAYTLQPVKGAEVLAFLADTAWNDSLVFQRPPDFAAQCSDSGKFILEGLPSLPVRLIALADKDGDLQCDDPSVEAIGKFPRILALPQDSIVDLRCSAELPVKPRLTRSSRSDRHAAVLAFNRPVESLQLLPADKRLPPMWYASSSKDTVYVFTDQDSLNLLLVESGLCFDTLRMRLSAASGMTDVPSGIRLHVSAIPLFAGDHAPLRITCGRPLASVKDSVLVIAEKGDSLFAALTIADSLRGILELRAGWSQSGNYRLRFMPIQIIDRFGARNDSIELAFRIPAVEELGAIDLTVKGWSGKGPGILQLLTTADEVMRAYSISGDTTMHLAHLAPGPIRLRLIADTNSDGRWTPGQLAVDRAAEQVWIHPVAVLVRARWDTDAVFTVD
ncbi:MAG: Ig-like domain-containing protein [Bacteroidota bacterium]